MVSPRLIASNGRVFRLAGTETTVGRRGCDINLIDAQVADLHARLRRVGANILIESAGAPVWLNDLGVKGPVPVADGDRLRFGRSELVAEGFGPREATATKLVGLRPANGGSRAARRAIRPFVLVGGVVAFVIAGLLGGSLWLSQRTTPLLAFAKDRAPAYETLERLSDGADHQKVTMRTGGETIQLGLRSYSNERSLTADDWLRATWDPGRLIVTRPIVTRAGTGVSIADFSAWSLAHEGESDFPILAVLLAGSRIVVVDRLNGAYVDTATALQLISNAAAP